MDLRDQRDQSESLRRFEKMLFLTYCWKISHFLLFQKLLVVVLLINQISSSLQVPYCSSIHQNARKTLKSLRHNFLFVEKSSPSLETSLEIPKRVTRDVRVPGTTMCPWRWTLDDSPDRVPRFLTKAVCPHCGHYCRAVLYHHKGLVQSCDVRTGEKVWKWIQVKLPVAFVYDSWTGDLVIYN